MRISIFLAVLLLIVANMFAIGWAWSYNGHDHHEQEQGTLASTDSIMVQSHSNLEGQKQLRKAHPMQVAGSRLPDCTHACGSCSPCRLVMVSFVPCASLTQAEPCPISYRCMCNGKSYPVP
ncbi:hypothetical protein RGQ29_027244 [Quercus rubra]|uniref:Epidermal patterning factor-like protein n=1 Tax=Quercus rubra TaxID=3512 RepID=A0AAN7ENL5_QUERU|nr:hypothetical protein RGQ29_027244 [Quercus rubra]